MKQRHIIFEVTARCQHACPHCYNIWRDGVAPPAELDTPTTLKLLDRALDQTGASLVTLTGGEPLLRPDLPELVDHLNRRDREVVLITNGGLLDEAMIQRLTPGRITTFELPLLGPEPLLHDKMSGRQGAFDPVTLAMASLKEIGETVVAVFVATRLNLPAFRETAELAIALGADGIMFNRFNPGGAGRQRIEALQASPEELAAALDIAQELTGVYGVGINCSIAMPPCLFERSRWPDLGFGFCAVGTDQAYFTIDPQGNVRPCNHSTTVLGNLLHQDWQAITTAPELAGFTAARPAFCSGCALATRCQGGCKAAAQVCSGDVTAMDPFLAAFHHRAHRIEADDPAADQSGPGSRER